MCSPLTNHHRLIIKCYALSKIGRLHVLMLVNLYMLKGRLVEKREKLYKMRGVVFRILSHFYTLDKKEMVLGLTY